MSRRSVGAFRLGPEPSLGVVVVGVALSVGASGVVVVGRTVGGGPSLLPPHL